jgi:iron(III) transport system substrate-binding protein
LRERKLLLGLAIAALKLAACSAGATADMSPRAENSGELIVYSGRSESLVQPVFDRFAEETGIQVRVKYGGTAELAATLLEEGERSPADVFFAQDPGGMGAVEAARLLAPLPAEIFELVPARFASPHSLWIGVSGRARVVVYNTDRLDADDLPADLWGFTDARWRGRIGWAPTNGSFQAMVTAMRAVWGEEKTRRWLTAMKANDPVVYESNTPIVAAVGAGEVDAGFVNHYYLYRFLAEHGEAFPARNYFMPGSTPGSLVMVSAAGVLESSTNKANAERFVAFLLSRETQQYFSDQTFEYPVAAGVATSPLLPTLEELNAQGSGISLTQLADLEHTALMLSELGILP